MNAVSLPTPQQLSLPLIDVLRDNGPMQARDAIAAVGDRLGISAEARAVRVPCGQGNTTNLFCRKVRWVRQNLVLAGLIAKGDRGVWTLTEKSNSDLTMAQPGMVITVARDESGAVLWAEALSAVGYIEDESLSCILTSPPYPLGTQLAYGGWSPDEYLETLLEHIDAMRPKLRRDGSMIVNLGDVYMRGLPVLNTYQEELAIEMKRRGWNLAGRHYWCSPAKPKTTPHVTRARTRIAAGVEQFWWWSPTPNPKADNRRVLQPYAEVHKRALAQGGWIRKGDGTSRHCRPGVRYAADNGGSIPFNFTVCAGEGSQSAYMRHCRAHGLPHHPARMPRQLAEHFVRLCTEPGQIVFDPFGGSLTTAEVCQKLGRYYITSERCLEYIRGGLFRLGAAPDRARTLDPAGL